MSTVDESDLIRSGDLAKLLGRSPTYVCGKANRDSRFRRAKVGHGQFSRSKLIAAGILASTATDEEKRRERLRKLFAEIAEVL